MDNASGLIVNKRSNEPVSDLSSSQSQGRFALKVNTNLKEIHLDCHVLEKLNLRKEKEFAVFTVLSCVCVCMCECCINMCVYV